MSLFGTSSDDASFLPVLFLVIDRDGGVVEFTGSKVLIGVLGVPQVGQKFTDYLFLEDWSSLSSSQREMILELGKCAGDPPMVGELLAAQLPLKFSKTLSEGAKKSEHRLAYSFIEKAGLIDCVVITVFPRNEISVDFRSENTGESHLSIEVRNEHESSMAETLLQLLRADGALFEIVAKEVESHLLELSRLMALPLNEKLDEFRRIFHAMKGSTRQLGLAHFSKKCLSCEQWMKDSIKAGFVDGGAALLRTRVEEIEKDWKKILTLRQALH